MRSTYNKSHLYSYIMAGCIIILLIIDRYNSVHGVATRFLTYPASLIARPLHGLASASVFTWLYLALILFSLVCFANLLQSLNKVPSMRQSNIFWHPASLAITMATIIISSCAILFFHAAPIFVSIHFIAMLLLLVQCWFWAVRGSRDINYLSYRIKPMRTWIAIGIFLWCLEMIVSIWASSHYAGIGCATHGHCHQLGWTFSNIKRLFAISIDHSINYKYGVMPMAFRQLLQSLHIVTSYVFSLYVLIVVVLLCYKNRYNSVNYYGWIFLGLLALEITLGILNSHWVLPLWIDLAHAMCAIIWLLAWIDLLFYLHNVPTQRLQGKKVESCS